MNRETFERLWEVAFARDGDLLGEAVELAHLFDIPGPMVAVRLARALREAGLDLFLYCNRVSQARDEYLIRRAHREQRLVVVDLEFVKILLIKAKNSW